MAQQSNTTNWIFPQSLNGQPQVVKLLQAIPTSSKGINSTIAGQPVKMYKTVHSHQESIQTTMTSAQVIKTFGSKLTATPVPAGTYAQTYQKTPDGKLIARTVRLTPQQMQNVKFLPNPQKIQLASSPQLNIKPKPLPQESPELVRIARKRDAFDLDFTPETKRKKTEKIGKGLRHFSMKVCEKVKMKKTTTYNEVADELVTEFSNSAKNNSLAEQYDQKNIRRRVYDALNVLMAMNIISKEKKEIRWIGLPSNSQKEHADLEREKRQRLQSIRDKTRLLQELIMNQISFKNLAHRNKQAEESHGVPTQNSYIQLPFIVVNTDKKTVIDCSISNDKMEYHFHFNDKFEILDDLEVLKKIGMLKGIDKGECSEEDLQLFKSFVPKSLEQYVDQLAQGSNGMEEFDDMTSPEDRCEQGTSHEQYISDDMIEATLGEDSHHSSSFDAMSPVNGDFSDDDDLDSDISSEDS